MLMLKKNFKIKDLKNYGFLLEPEGSYYFKRIDEDIEIQIQIRNSDVFKKYEIGIYSYHASYSNELDIIYELIKNNIIEVIKNENE